MSNELKEATELQETVEVEEAPAKKKKKSKKEKPKKRKKICLISSSGGHYEQLRMLKVLEEKYDIFWVTEKTDYEGNADYYLSQTGLNDGWMLFRMIGNAFKTLRFFIKERPNAIITTGTMIALPACLFGRLFGKKVIYIESFARVRDCTKAGKLVYKLHLANLFIYQWEYLEEIYPKGVYGGSIY